MKSRFLVGFYVLFCFELGVFLFVFPWVSLWGRNYFVDHYPLVGLIATNHFVRGAISGLGLADIWLGLWELWHFRENLTTFESR